MRKFNYKKYLYPCVVSVIVAFFVGGAMLFHKLRPQFADVL